MRFEYSAESKQSFKNQLYRCVKEIGQAQRTLQTTLEDILARLRYAYASRVVCDAVTHLKEIATVSLNYQDDIPLRIFLEGARVQDIAVQDAAVWMQNLTEEVAECLSALDRDSLASIATERSNVEENDFDEVVVAFSEYANLVEGTYEQYRNAFPEDENLVTYISAQHLDQFFLSPQCVAARAANEFIVKCREHFVSMVAERVRVASDIRAEYANRNYDVDGTATHMTGNTSTSINQVAQIAAGQGGTYTPSKQNEVDSADAASIDMGAEDDEAKPVCVSDSDIFGESLLEAVMSTLQSYGFSTMINHGAVISSFVAQAKADGFESRTFRAMLSQTAAKFFANVTAFSQLDYYQSEGSCAKSSSEEQAANALSHDLMNAFMAREAPTYDDKHRYSQLIGRTRSIYNGENDPGVPLMSGFQSIWDQHMEQQNNFHSAYHDQLETILADNCTMSEFVMPIFEFLASESNRFFSRVLEDVNELLGEVQLHGEVVVADDFEAFVPETEGRSDLMFSADSPRHFGINAATKQHFLHQRYLLRGMQSNFQYYYEVIGDNGQVTYYNYETDEYGRIIHAFTDCLVMCSGTERNTGHQSKVGKNKGRLSVDDGGHIFGTRFGGSGLADNMLAQHMAINEKATDPNKERKGPFESRKGYKGGQWFRLEQFWADRLSENPPATVSVDIRILYDRADTQRPSEYQIVSEFAMPSGKTMLKSLCIKNEQQLSLSKERRTI